MILEKHVRRWEREEISALDMVSARNLVGFCGVRSGDNVLLLQSETTHPIIAKAVELAIHELGGNVNYLNCPKAPRIHGILMFSELPHYFDMLSKAYYGADIVIQIGIFGGGAFMGEEEQARMEHGMSYCMADVHSLEMFRSDYFTFPYELTALIGEKTFQRVMRGRTFHVTAPSGTDYHCAIKANKYGVSGAQSAWINRKLRRPGDWSMFPSGTFGTYCDDDAPAEGIFVADYQPPLFCCEAADKDPFMKRYQKPTKYTIEERWITKVEGAFADELIELWETKGDKYSRRDAGPMWGINPKAEPIGLGELDPMASYFPFHSSPMMYHQHIACGWVMGAGWGSSVMGTPYCYKPTITIDGEPIIQDGQLTEVIIDDQVRETAERYGDPDDVLRPVREPYEDMFGWRYESKV